MTAAATPARKACGGSRTDALLAVLFTAFLGAGCAPRLSLESEAVQTAELRDAMKCRHLGVAKVSAGVDLLPGDKKSRIKAELSKQARDLAVEIGADTVVATGEIADGEQNFRLYICNVQP